MAIAAVLAIAAPPASAAISDGRLGGPPVESGSADDTLCPAGQGVTGVEGKTRDLSGFIPIVVVATVQCTSGGLATGTMGSGEGDTGSTSCPSGQVAVGISGREGDFVDLLQLRCGNPDGSGVITTSDGFGGGGGTNADGPYDCAVGEALTGLTGQTVFDGTSIRYLEIVCGVISDGRLGGPPVESGSADDTLCPAGQGVTGVEGKTRDLSGFIPIVVVATVQCTNGSAATGTMGSGEGDPGSTSCPSGQVAVGISGREGDFVDLLQLRCRNEDGSGAITTSDGFGGGGGTNADGPFECLPGEALTGLTGQTVFDGTSIRYLEIVCGTVAVEPVDSAAPVTTASLSPAANAAGWNNSDVTLDLSASDDASAVDSITYSATGAQSTIETTIAGSSVSVPVTQEGATTFTYFATDAAGNAESPQTIEVRLDKTAPSLGLPQDSTLIAPQGDDGMVVGYTMSATDALDADPSLSCTPASGTLFPIGVTTVSCSATDHADNTSQGGFTVTVQTPAQATQSLAETVASYDLHAGMERSLTEKLRNATAALEEGRTADACGALGAFINQVQAQSGKKLTTEQAAALQAGAIEIREAAGC